MAKAYRKQIICIAISLSIYLLNNLFLKDATSGYVNIFCRCYLNDLMCPIFFIAYCQMFLIRLGHELKSYWIIMAVGAVCAFLWEFVAPLVNPRSVSDWYDIVCFIAGTNIYYFATREKMIKVT